MAISKGQISLVTYKECLKYLHSLNYDLAPLWFLLCEITNKKRSDILLAQDELIPPNQLLRLQLGINRLIKENYPPQYFVGHTYFFGRKFYVKEGVLIPRFDTEILVEKTLENLNDAQTILDLGTGSGAIAITLKKERPYLNVSALDISVNALELTKINAAFHNAKLNLIHSDLFNEVSNLYDVIVTNPPYLDLNEDIMEIVKKYEPHLALYSAKQGLEISFDIIKRASSFLSNNGLLIMELHSESKEQIASLANEYFSSVNFYKDNNNHTRVMVARRFR